MPNEDEVETVNQMDVLRAVCGDSDILSQQILVPFTQVTETRVSKQSAPRNFAGAFFLSKGKNTVVEVRAFSDTFITFETLTKKVPKNSTVYKNVGASQKVLRVLLGL